VLAATYPAEVSHLSVIDVVPPGAGLEQAIAQPNVGKLWFFHFMSAEGMPEVLTAGKEREYLSYFYDNFAARREALTAEAVDEYVRHYSSPGGMSAGFAYYRAFMQDVAQVQELVKTKLPMPTLGVGGDKSFGAGVEYFLRAVADDVHGAVLPNTGHFVAEEQPEELSRLLLELFSR
jgi:pimeloyl-ACP methyl ester carboxylesterase